MKNETAKAVHQFFDQISLEVYVADRTQDLYKQLSFAEDIERVRSYQGAIRELELLLKAKEYAKNILDKR